jgi:hypothetical protein
MKNLECDIAADSPRLSSETEATPMVPDSCFGSYMFSQVASHYPLGIGAEVAGDCYGFSRGIALEYQEGFALA